MKVVVTDRDWTYSGRVEIRPLDRGIVIDDDRYLDDAIGEFQRAGRSGTSSVFADVRITATRIDGTTE